MSQSFIRLKLHTDTEARVNSKMAKIAYRYCKPQTIAVCKGLSILIIKRKRTSCSSRD